MINVRVMLLVGLETIRASKPIFLLQIYGLPLLLALVLWYFISWKAALVVVAVQVGLFLFALAVTAAQMEKILDIRLEPWPFRAVVNRDRITRLADDLLRLGFTPAGQFKVTGKDLFVEGFARPDLKIYAMVTSGNEDSDAYVEFSCDYENGGSYCVSGGKHGGALPRPANMVLEKFPGKSTEELLGIMLRCRPDYGLNDTPPEAFQHNVENSLRIMKEYLLPRKKA